MQWKNKQSSVKESHPSKIMVPSFYAKVWGVTQSLWAVPRGGDTSGIVSPPSGVPRGHKGDKCLGASPGRRLHHDPPPRTNLLH